MARRIWPLFGARAPPTRLRQSKHARFTDLFGHGDATSGSILAQIKFASIGEKGQSRLGTARALICGCGALGSVIAERLARSGVGALRIVDRDWVELSNLQRQALFTEADAQASTPKAVAAATALGHINSTIEVEPIVADVSCANIRELATDCDVILDGTDNFETRFLINDFSVDSGTPWIHGGCLGAGGQAMTIVPEESACFRCLVPELPPREAMETCDSAGVLAPAIGLIANWQAAEALKLLSGNRSAACRSLLIMDSWNSECRLIGMPRSRTCATCQDRDFVFLRGDLQTSTTVLCGKNAVQLESPAAQNESLEGIASKLAGLGVLTQNAYFVRLKQPEYTLTIFRGGRTVVEGTTSEQDAKSILARTIGS